MAQVRRYEIILAIVGVMFYAGTFSFGLAEFLPPRTSTLVRYGVLAGSLVLLCQRWRGSLLTIVKGGWIWGVILLLGLSFAWSINPAQVIGNVRSELIPMLFLSLYMGSRFSIKEQFRIAAWAFGLSILASVLLIMLFPEKGIHPPDSPWPGAWRGVFVHKNAFGAYLVLTTSTLFMLASHARERKGVLRGLLIVCIVAVFWSTSKTALVLSVVSIILMYLYKSYRWMGIKSVLWLNLSTYVALGLAGIITAAWGPIMAAFGKEPTLSGRTLIWTFLIEQKIPNSPLLGYGRNVFWGYPQLFGGIYAAADHVPGNAHNGFIDMILSIGLLGFFFFVLAWGTTYSKALRLLYHKKEPAYIWPPIFLTLLVLNNIMESLLVNLSNAFWLLFVAFAFTFNRQPMEVLISEE